MPNTHDDLTTRQDEYLALAQKHDEIAARVEKAVEEERKLFKDPNLSEKERNERHAALIAELEELSKELEALMKAVEGLNGHLGNKA